MSLYVSKTGSKRAAWLGNDESHYKRTWNDKDINDLKVLINLTRYWIVAEIKTAKYMETMNNQTTVMLKDL